MHRFIPIICLLLFVAPVAAQSSNAQYLPLAMSVQVAPTPPPSVPTLLPLPAGLPTYDHTLLAFVIDEHPVSLNKYFFVVAKQMGNQDGLVLRLRPGATTTELVYLIDGNSAQFPGPIAPGSGVLTRAGGMILSFSACAEAEPAPPSTGCKAYYYEIANVDVPFATTARWRDWVAVEVQP